MDEGRSTTTRSRSITVNAITRLVLVETLGGIARPTKQFLHVFANKEVAGTTRTGVWGGVGDQHQQAGAHWGH